MNQEILKKALFEYKFKIESLNLFKIESKLKNKYVVGTDIYEKINREITELSNINNKLETKILSLGFNLEEVLASSNYYEEYKELYNKAKYIIEKKKEFEKEIDKENEELREILAIIGRDLHIYDKNNNRFTEIEIKENSKKSIINTRTTIFTHYLFVTNKINEINIHKIKYHSTFIKETLKNFKEELEVCLLNLDKNKVLENKESIISDLCSLTSLETFEKFELLNNSLSSKEELMKFGAEGTNLEYFRKKIFLLSIIIIKLKSLGLNINEVLKTENINEESKQRVIKTTNLMKNLQSNNMYVQKHNLHRRLYNLVIDMQNFNEKYDAFKEVNATSYRDYKIFKDNYNYISERKKEISLQLGKKNIDEEIVKYIKEENQKFTNITKRVQNTFKIGNEINKFNEIFDANFITITNMFLDNEYNTVEEVIKKEKYEYVLTENVTAKGYFDFVTKRFMSFKNWLDNIKVGNIHNIAKIKGLNTSLDVRDFVKRYNEVGNLILKVKEKQEKIKIQKETELNKNSKKLYELSIKHEEDANKFNRAIARKKEEILVRLLEQNKNIEETRKFLNENIDNEIIINQIIEYLEFRNKILSSNDIGLYFKNKKEFTLLAEKINTLTILYLTKDEELMNLCRESSLFNIISISNIIDIIPFKSSGGFSKKIKSYLETDKATVVNKFLSNQKLFIDAVVKGQIIQNYTPELLKELFEGYEIQVLDINISKETINSIIDTLSVNNIKLTPLTLIDAINIYKYDSLYNNNSEIIFENIVNQIIREKKK